MSQMGIQTHYAVCCSTMVLISLLILFTYIMIATPAAKITTVTIIPTAEKHSWLKYPINGVFAITCPLTTLYDTPFPSRSAISFAEESLEST